MKTSDIVQGNIAYHNTLSPVAWQDSKLRPEIRLQLLRIAKLFISYLDLPDFKIKDIVLTGSMANYNYTKYSDFDIHVVTDYSDINADDLAEAFYQAKKRIWNDAHDITIYGHETELYVEDSATPPVSAGMYSLLNGKWIKEPKYSPPAINDSAVNAKTRDAVRQINDAIASDDSAVMKHMIDKIGQMRKSGLAQGGEFSVENLAFKILRNQGHINRLHEAYIGQQDKELSLK